MQAVDEKRIDQIVVYKIDRLTRSLADFAKLVDRLDAAETSFVSVTQSFNTATSMGRLTLNMLLSFAQFEREVTAERIRDKIAASKRKGMWMGGSVPLGFQPDGRTLKIDEAEAETIRTLYDLYLEHRTLRDVKEQAENLDLRSRCRERAGGRMSGGTHFDRGHVQHILSNPVYAGRIRHKKQVYEGQHPAIIDPAIWEKVQDMLQSGAAVARGSRQKATRSPLEGKLFDETGDRLTPSHSRKDGKRLRYYISRRLVKDRSRKHPDAWRLPADQVEGLLAELIGQHLVRPGVAVAMTEGLTAAELTDVSKRFQEQGNVIERLALIERVDLQPGSLTVRLDKAVLADRLGCIPEQINPEELTVEAPFQMRRRGVELKLHLGAAPAEIDRTLVQNIMKGRNWLATVIAGKTFSEIADTEGVSKRRVQDVTNLALLAPDVLDRITTGEQPDGLTTDYLIKTRFSAVWSEQREQFARL
ncbi:recombinase family protein [Aliiroseovarius crassostreae]|uniref:recombinase family protein n=1 Tax=Aliiroseovarius crassostreae TaxID=154981 RepID=UPI003C79CB1A